MEDPPRKPADREQRAAWRRTGQTGLDLPAVPRCGRQPAGTGKGAERPRLVRTNDRASRPARRRRQGSSRVRGNGASGGPKPRSGAGRRPSGSELVESRHRPSGLGGRAHRRRPPASTADPRYAVARADVPMHGAPADAAVRSGGGPWCGPFGVARWWSSRPRAAGGPTQRRGRPRAAADSVPARGGAAPPQRGAKKRTSRNTDERNPTRSGIQIRARARRSREPEPEAQPKERPSLRPRAEGRRRRDGSDQGYEAAPAAGAQGPASGPVDRGLRGAQRVRGPRRIPRAAGPRTRRPRRSTPATSVTRVRILRPLREAYPDVAAIRGLVGLSHYRLGQFPAAGASSAPSPT